MMPTPVSSPGTTQIPEPPAFPELRTSESPDMFFRDNFWDGPWLWIVIILIFLLIVGVIWMIYKRKNRPVPPPPTPAQFAIHSLEALRTAMPPLRQVAVQCSLILRQFLTGETQDPTLYETQQEFNRRPNSLATLPSEFQIPVRDLLDRLAELKYEPASSDDKAKVNELVDQTVTIINGIDEQNRRKEEEETDLVSAKSSSHHS